MRWSYKQFLGLALLILGLIGIFMARHYMGEISEAKSAVEFITSPFSDSPVGGFAKKGLMGKVSEYDTQVQVLMYGGIACLIAGIIVLFVCWRRKA